MRYILIPVKDLTRAKQRLAALLTQAERTQLAWAMLENTFAAAAQTRTIDRIAVITLYEPALELAEKFGMEVILERDQISESASVDFGSRELLKRSAEAVLRLPIDLPLITAEDIEQILACDRPVPSTVIVPSHETTGTNAILRRPPALFPSHFGPGSLAKHQAEAERLGIPCTLLDLPRIALDIDEPADVAALLKTGDESPVVQWLKEQSIGARLAQFQAQSEI
jgi:2-phospho-L-lactate/phosphoenolpyruvate guanylyltransferase